GFAVSAPANCAVVERLGEGASVSLKFGADGAILRRAYLACDQSSQITTYGVTGTFLGASYSSYALNLTPSHALTAKTFYDGGGNVVASKTLTADGGYVIAVNGATKLQKTAFADGGYDL